MASCSCPDRQTMILMTPMTLDIYFYRRCSRRQWTFVTSKNLWRKTKQSSSIGLLQIFGGKKDPFYDGAPRTSIALWMDGVINTQMSPLLSLDLWLIATSRSRTPIMPNVNLYESETNASGLYGGFSAVEIKFTESFFGCN